MKRINYGKFMLTNPTQIGQIQNQLGQEVIFYEDPNEGDLAEVIAVIHDYKEAVWTSFFDTADFFEGSDYNPCYMHGKIECAWEYDL